MGVRKRETERIERENHAFAKRLFDKQAVLRKKALDEDWTAHLQYKKQISKMPGLSKNKSVFGSMSQYRKPTAGGFSNANIMGTPEQIQA